MSFPLEDVTQRFSQWKPFRDERAYVMGKKIGEGDFGETFEAFDKATGQRVVVKSLFPTYGDDDFQHELKALWAIKTGCVDNNVACLIDEVVQGGTRYLVMEYAPGHTLQHFVAAFPTWPQSKQNWVARQLFHAVAYVHSHGLAHGDIKPNNIMFDQQTGELTLIDFGVALLNKDCVCGDPACGCDGGMYTPEFPVTAESADVFGAALTLVEMTTGRYVGQIKSYAKRVTSPPPVPHNQALIDILWPALVAPQGLTAATLEGLIMGLQVS